MPRTWLILDVHNLAYRAFFTTGGLSFNEDKTGTLYGLLRDVRQLEQRFGVRDFAFCFDVGVSKRKALFPGYRAGRHFRLDEKEVQALKDMRTQVARFRDDLLPEMGFTNVFHADGYEADDVVASCVSNLGNAEHAVLVTEDQDFYQLLSPAVTIWRPRKQEMMTEEMFKAQYHVSPHQWPAVKALAGCPTDNVPGMKGVAELTACRYVSGQRQVIASRNPGILPQIDVFVRSDEYRRNLSLVRLPFQGTPKFRCQPHSQVSDQAWEAVMKKLGIRSLPGHVDRKSLPSETLS